MKNHPATQQAKTEQRIGQQIRSCHPWAYRSGEWATIIGITEICVHENEQRGCYQLEWPDGATDDWAIIAPIANYEFKDPHDDLQQ